MLIAVIGGPIASGKSSLGCATAARLQDVRGAEVAVIDLDLIYEMLDPRARSGRPKSDERMWSQARRLACAYPPIERQNHPPRHPATHLYGVNSKPRD